MIVAGYVAAVFIGLVLGLIGAGGAVLAVPVLVYLFGIDPMLATAYSLFIVGVTSSIGAAIRYKLIIMHLRIAMLFAVPSLTTIFLTRMYVIPAIPPVIFEVGGFQLTKGAMLLSIFAIVMFFSAFSMIRNEQPEEEAGPTVITNYFILVLRNAAIGVLFGLVGAGGGFLIVPALVIVMKLPMKHAIGTSLFIVSINTLLGFLGDVANQAIDWQFLAGFCGISVAGMLFGSFLGKKIDGKHLKKGFGWFVLTMAVLIFAKEIFLS
jgi:uncharacterized protein